MDFAPWVGTPLYPNLMDWGDGVGRGEQYREPQKLRERRNKPIQKLKVGVLPSSLTYGVAVKGRSGSSLPAQASLLAFPRGWGADGSSSLGPSEARSAGAMWLTLAVGTRPEPAA
jgi:hypothetical protein